MRPSTKRLLFWSPRILAFVFILFVSMFALDVFHEGRPVGEMILALFIHLLPSFGITIVLLLAWWREWIGVAIFPLISVFFIFIIRDSSPWYVYVIFATPPVIVAVLFLFGWLHRKEIRNLHSINATVEKPEESSIS